MILEKQNPVDGVQNGVNFICGVVEGFYGRPWTTFQRKDLFKRMESMGMTTYLYAPKDDCKHRMYWRDLYTVEEADHLTSLIQAAESKGVTFVYALSPGLDMSYSNVKEVATLKRKLDQVSSFGCKAFAILFDDIEADMCEADMQVFHSFAQAQVSVTNEVYQHLGQPELFLFCPTEYCATRAVPAVETSDYLATIGSKLLPGVDIMWTGPRVISKKVTIKSIEELSKVLQRPPVIWDNIHANDYDQRRLFLGPYEGRSTELVPYLRGVMTNPNTEYEANFVAFHTLSQWCKSNQSGLKRDIIHSQSPVSADIKLETDGEFESDEDIPVNSSNAYSPRQALYAAVQDWLTEFTIERDPIKKKMTSVPLPENLTAPTTTLPGGTAPTVPSPLSPSVPNLNQLAAVDLGSSLMQPSHVVAVNSLVDPLSSDSEPESPADRSTAQMDCDLGCITTLDSAASNLSSRDSFASSTISDCVGLVEMEIEQTSSNSMGCMVPDTSSGLSEQDPDVPSTQTGSSKSCISHSDVLTLVDLFYLPFKHGQTSVSLLEDLCWLKTNTHLVQEQCLQPECNPLAASEWSAKANALLACVRRLIGVIDKVCGIPNRALMYDLFPYLWDMKGVLSHVETFVGWLALGHVPEKGMVQRQESPYTWSNVMYRDLFGSGDQEPWVFRGGVQAEIQRLLPLEGAPDLLLLPYPTIPDPKMFKIRPYLAVDKAAVYDVCRQTCDDGVDGTDIFPGLPDLIGDRLIGAFLSLSPEFCFVILDEEGICGYAVAALSAQDFQKKATEMYLPAMREKYPKTEKEEGLTPAEELINSFYSCDQPASDQFYARYPALARVNFLPDRCGSDLLAPKQALCGVVSALKIHGASGVHTEINVGDQNTVEFYRKLGFFENPVADTPESLQLMGRLI